MAISPHVQTLQSLQKSLNEAIDRCVEADQKNNGEPSSELANAMDEVQRISIHLKVAATPAGIELLERAFMVNLPCFSEAYSLFI